LAVAAVADCIFGCISFEGSIDQLVVFLSVYVQ
jgi:hypothetical protein